MSAAAMPGMIAAATSAPQMLSRIFTSCARGSSQPPATNRNEYRGRMVPGAMPRGGDCGQL
jgi:hypothetical protein